MLLNNHAKTHLCRVGGDLCRVGGDLCRVGGDLCRVEGDLCRVGGDLCREEEDVNFDRVEWDAFFIGERDESSSDE